SIRLLSIFMIMSALMPSASAITVEEVFLSAPREVIPLIDFVKRDEMVKLYNAGMASKADPNLLGGDVEILSITPDAMTLRHGNGGTLTVALLPMAGGDTAVMMLENIETPAIDANVRVYALDWTPLSGVWEEPSVADWALKNRGAEAASEIPFMLAEGRWNAAERSIELTPTIGEWLDEDKRGLPAELLRPQLTMKWNGKKFMIKK
ncbi:MAG: DUF3256 family protein, partial [Muribaculaceae bacterium]|nr:DUF3256 family protein [Muribaculaceae bacterium]